MTTYDEMLTLWRHEVDAGGARQRRVKSHPLPLYFGANEASMPLFFLISDDEPSFPRIADVVAVGQGRRDDGRWTVVLTLRDKALTDAFMGLCVELTRRSAAARDSSTALAIFFETLHQWKALLQSSAPRRMPDQQIRGLVAELWFALNVLGENRPMAAVLLAWQGPYGAPQDFQTADGAMFEVKSVHSESTSIEISSADQLDPASGGPLTLSLVVVDEVPVGTPGSHTLVSLAAEFASRLQHNQYDLGELNHRLDALSLDLSDEHYGGRYYAVGQPRSFGVGEEFPRIVRANVPLAINRLTYRLRIAGFEAFEEKVEQSS